MTEGSQSTITGARLLYSIEAAGAEQLVSLPFVIGVLADFGGSAGRGVALEDRRLVDVSAARLDRVLKAWAPEVTIALAGDVAGTSGQTIVLRFRAIDDFRPAGVERLVAAALAESLASPPTAEQIAAVVDDRRLRELQSAWNGLAHLVAAAADTVTVQVRMLQVTKAELAASFRSAPNADRTVIFRKIYEDEFGMMGGQPYGLLLADFAFNHSAADIETLDNLAWLGAEAMCAVVARAAPEMFFGGDWQEVARHEALDSLFSSKAHLPWRALREHPNARHLALVVPGRLPDAGAGGLYELAGALARTYALTGRWQATQESRHASMPFSEGQHAQLARCGFLPLSGDPDSPVGTARETPTVQRPQRHPDGRNDALAQQQALLPVVLSTLEYGRAIKCIVRDRIGSFASTEDAERYLNEWLAGYVGGSSDRSLSDPDALPLDDGRVEVRNPPGLGRQLGYYEVKLYLRPRLAGLEFTDSLCYEMKLAASSSR